MKSLKQIAREGLPCTVEKMRDAASDLSIGDRLPVGTIMTLVEWDLDAVVGHVGDRMFFFRKTVNDTAWTKR